MPIKHTTTKAPGQKLFAVADWNADHVGTITVADISDINTTYLAIDGSNANSNIDIGAYDFTVTDLNATNLNATNLKIDHIAEKTPGHNVVVDNKIIVDKWWSGYTGSGTEFVYQGDPGETLFVKWIDGAAHDWWAFNYEDNFPDLTLSNHWGGVGPEGVFNIETDVNITGDANIGGTAYVDTITEKTADAGVTIEGVELKDNNVTGTSFIKSGGTSSQILHADGSVTTMQKGSNVVGWVPGQNKNTTINFPSAFASTPTVVATLSFNQTSAPRYDYEMHWQIHSITTTGFIFQVSSYMIVPSSGTVKWIAWV